MEEEVLGKAYDGRLMRRLLRYMWPYRSRVLVSLLCLFVYSLLQVCGPLLTKTAIDRYLTHQGGSQSGWLWWLAAEPRTGILQITLLYLAVLAATFVAEFGQTMIMQYTGQLAMFDLRTNDAPT